MAIFVRPTATVRQQPLTHPHRPLVHNRNFKLTADLSCRKRRNFGLDRLFRFSECTKKDRQRWGVAVCLIFSRNQDGSTEVGGLTRLVCEQPELLVDPRWLRKSVESAEDCTWIDWGDALILQHWLTERNARIRRIKRSRRTLSR